MIFPEQVPETLKALTPYMAQVAEVQVLDWSNRAQYGCWAKFRLPDAGFLKGYETGQRFHMILIAIGDDDMPAAGEGKERKPYKLSQIAGMLCADPLFWPWLTGFSGQKVENKDQAAAVVRDMCNVDSRSLLDSDQEAGEIFRAMAKSFDEWKQAHEPAEPHA